MGIAFDNTYARLPERFFSSQHPAPVPDAVLIRYNRELGEQLGIPEDPGMFSGNQLPEGAQPIAQAYAGHQFGGFNPQLGDGRAILLGEVLDARGNRRDVQLKGSGRTAFSRGGDGKSALGPVLREYIVSEAMHALGVPTTRALAAVATREAVMREEPTPGGVFTRVAASHIRVGTFQFFAAREDTEAIRTLVDYCIARHYPHAAAEENPVLAFLEAVIASQATLMTRWLPLGFIHGVMNTDNCSISGETIDYGPCAFMDNFHPDCVFSYIDRQARYAWGNQPTICHWNMARLAETLLPLLAGDPGTAKELATTALDKFIGHFQQPYLNTFREKLGLSTDGNLEASEAFLKSTLGTMAREEVDFSLFFRHLTARNDSELTALFNDPAAARKWLADWENLPKPDDSLERMKAVNPIRIPRNHQIEKVIQAAYRDDFAPFHRMVEAMKDPFTEKTEYADLEAAPLPSERIQNTFCGT
eukprot:g3518.t1